MRKILISLLVLLCVCSKLFSQETSITGKSYVTKNRITVYAVTNNLENVDTNIRFAVDENIRFTVVEITAEGYAIIEFWKFNDNKAKDKEKYYKTFNVEISKDIYQIKKNEELPFESNDELSKKIKENFAFIDAWANHLKFAIRIQTLNQNCETIYPASTQFTWGFLSIPIKSRFKNSQSPFTFEENINFGLCLGIKFQRPTRVYTAHNLLMGISIGNVRNDTASASALTFSLGYMYQFDKFQAGIFTGLDYIAGKEGIKWAFQGKPWIGFGLGFSLFGDKEKKAASSQSQE